MNSPRLEGISLDDFISKLSLLRSNGLPGDARVVIHGECDCREYHSDVIGIAGRIDINLDEAGPVKQLIIEAGFI